MDERILEGGRTVKRLEFRVQRESALVCGEDG
jgi:hypothetical protein